MMRFLLSLVAAAGGALAVSTRSKLFWLPAIYPDPEKNIERCGRGGKVSHVCDPDKLLNPAVVDAADQRLQNMATGGPGQCGLRVYFAVMQELGHDYASNYWTLSEAFKNFAQEVGHQWHVFGSSDKCKNGVVAVYSVHQQYMVIVPDPALRHQLPEELANHIARQALRSHMSPNAVLPIAVDLLDHVANGLLTDGQLALSRTMVFLYLLICVFGLVTSLLIVCCVYDQVTKYRTLARFSACKRSMERLSKKGATDLCPLCVQDLPEKGPKVVVFLCGHRFHADCSSQWSENAGHRVPRCPICLIDGVPEGTGSGDEVVQFGLRSLHEMYPDMISFAEYQRWRNMRSDIWIEELKCAEVTSVFRR